MKSIGKKISLDQKSKNKIYFKDEEDNKGDQLFSDSDSDNKNDDVDEFKIKKQFEGTKGQKLLELQARFHKDSRFNLDERFYESEDDDDEKNEEDNEDKNKELTVEEEVSKQLEILNTIAPKVVTSRKDVHEGKEKKKRILTPAGVRFDPTVPDHEKFIVKPPVKTVEKVKEKDKTKKEKEDSDFKKDNKGTEKSKASDEIFYEISDDLKGKFSSSQGSTAGFSLSQLFQPSKSAAEEEPVGKIAAENSGKQISAKSTKKNVITNIESENVAGNFDTNDKSPNNKLLKTDNKTARLWQENFFFKQNDPRFEEVSLFFSEEKFLIETENFGVKREQLKQIIKKKLKNNLQKNTMFRRKLGRGKGKFKKNFNKNPKKKLNYRK